MEAAADRLLLMLQQGGAALPAEVSAACCRTLLECGLSDESRNLWPDGVSPGELLRRGKEGSGEPPRSPDRMDGAGRGVSSARLAAAAVEAYLAGRAERAERMMRILQRRQTASGEFLDLVAAESDLLAGESEESWRRRVLALKFYLDASLLRVATAFEKRGGELPAVIDSADGRVVAVREWFGLLPRRAEVADVGCGPGRFLAHLIRWFPEARLTGIDPCAAMLEKLPRGVQGLKGSLLRTGLDPARLDGAFAVESLEHSLLPRRGIAELCRIVRPGGRVLVIDKRRSKQALSRHEPWERWFEPDELAGWLRRYCSEVKVYAVSHAEGIGGKDLFLAASGRVGGANLQE